jgi:hypothetical protein
MGGRIRSSVALRIAQEPFTGFNDRCNATFPPTTPNCAASCTDDSRSAGRSRPNLYQIPVRATHGRDSQGASDVIHRGKRVGVCHGSGSRASGGLRGGATARAGEALRGRLSDATVVGAGGDLRGRVARRVAEGPTRCRLRPAAMPQFSSDCFRQCQLREHRLRWQPSVE